MASLTNPTTGRRRARKVEVEISVSGSMSCVGDDGEDLEAPIETFPILLSLVDDETNRYATLTLTRAEAEQVRRDLGDLGDPRLEETDWRDLVRKLGTAVATMLSADEGLDSGEDEAELMLREALREAEEALGEDLS